MIRIKYDVMLTERELESTWKSTRRVSTTSTFKEKKNISVKSVYDHGTCHQRCALSCAWVWFSTWQNCRKLNKRGVNCVTFECVTQGYTYVYIPPGPPKGKPPNPPGAPPKNAWNIVLGSKSDKIKKKEKHSAPKLNRFNTWNQAGLGTIFGNDKTFQIFRFRGNITTVQSNLNNTDTKGPELIVRVTEVHILYM